MPAAPVVLFDLDGTLVDTNYLHVDAWQGALRAAGHDVPAAEIHRRIGMGGDQLLSELVGPGDHTAVKDGWRTRFRSTRGEARALPGARDLLLAVAAAGGRVVIASSSEADDVEALLGVVDADGAIAAVTHGDDVEDAKPAPDVFEAALAQVGGAPDRALAVGDAVWDVRAAERAGLRCVTVGTGGTGARTLLAAGALEVHDSPRALLDDLAASALGSLLGLAR